MKPVSSYKGISGLSPHNILYSIYYRKAVKRRRYVLSVAWLCQNRVSRFTDPYGIVSLPSAFPSPFPSAIQSLEGPYHGSPVVGLWDRAGHYSRNGIIPTGLPSFSTSVPDRQGGLYETPMSCRCTKKSATCGERAVEALPGRTYIGFHTFANNRIPASMSLPRHKITIA